MKRYDTAMFLYGLFRVVVQNLRCEQLTLTKCQLSRHHAAQDSRHSAVKRSRHFHHTHHMKFAAVSIKLFQVTIKVEHNRIKDRKRTEKNGITAYNKINEHFYLYWTFHNSFRFSIIALNIACMHASKTACNVHNHVLNIAFIIEYLNEHKC